MYEPWYLMIDIRYKKNRKHFLKSPYTSVNLGRYKNDASDRVASADKIARCIVCDLYCIYCLGVLYRSESYGMVLWDFELGVGIGKNV